MLENGVDKRGNMTEPEFFSFHLTFAATEINPSKSLLF